jgi:amino acid adenylation domain-containing protein
VELENVEDVYPLSSTQAGMLFHSISAPHSGVYIGQIRCLLSGDLDLAALQTVWQEVLQRHPALRSAFLWDGLDQPLQVVRQRVELDWKVLDWSEVARQLQTTRLEALLLADRRAGFDLGDAPLMRICLIRLDDTRHQLVWTCHHLLVDGWSVAIVLEEVFRLYHARLESRDGTLPAAAPYRDYIAWLGSLELEESAAFWRGYLRGFSLRTSLRTPLLVEHTGESLHRVVQTRIPAAISALLLDSARELRITLNTLLHGAWSIVLKRYSDESDVVFGTTVAGRPAHLPGIQQSVGLFINTLPVRVCVDEDLILRDWLACLQENLLRIREHEHSPLVRIQEWSDMPRGEALFDTLLVLENSPPGETSDGKSRKLKLVDRESLDQSNYPLAVLVIPDEELRLILVYDPSIYSGETVEGILGHLQTLLSAMPSHQDQPIRELPILSFEEEQKLLVAWNDTSEALPCGISVLDLISEQFECAPESTALAFADQRLSYRELGTASDCLARHLVNTGVKCGDRVAICLERGPDLITGILAILKAGGVYVPLDPDYPGARHEYVMRDSGVRLLLTSGKLAPGLSAFAVTQLLLDEQLLRPGSNGERQALPGIEAEQPAYLIYTSGSSGNPKGVLVSHRNLLASTLARHSYYQDRPDVFLLLSSVAFDSSVAGIFWALSSGAELVISEHRIEQDIGRLALLIAREGVTHTLCLPSLYGLLLEHAAADLLKSLRTVIVAGEAVPAHLVQMQRARLPEVVLYNEYGPTEATVWCSVYNTRAHDPCAPVPIGKPVANTRLFILDGRQRLVPPGVPGEIYVAGEGVACGYWKKPEVTKQKFVTANLGSTEERLYRTGDLARYLADGNIGFLGRVDRQMKLRGYRIEPAEIESVLLQYPGVREAVVLLTGTKVVSNEPDSKADATYANKSRLTAYLTTVTSLLERPCIDSVEIRDYLRRLLPDYMIPASFHVLDSMPLLPNGKVDVVALGELRGEADSPGETGVEPRNAIERQLADIWCEVLQMDAVGVHDDFFQLGGDSILSIHIVSKANQQGLSLSPNDLFNFPTIARLGYRISATEIENSRTNPSSDIDAVMLPLSDSAEQRSDEGAYSADPQGTRCPFIMVHAGSLMVAALRSSLVLDRPVYVLTATKHWEQADLEHDTTVEQLAEGNLAELRSLQPTGPYFLGGYSMGAPIALEIAHRLRLAGEKVELLFLLDPPGHTSSRSKPGPLPVGTRNREVDTPSSQSDALSTVTRYKARISGLSMSEKIRFVAVKVKKRAIRYFVNRPRAFTRNRVVRPGAAQLAILYRRLGLQVPAAFRNHYVNTVYLDASRQYEFKPYDGPVVIFHANKNPGDKQIWESVTTGELMVEWFDGRHMDFLENPELLNRWTSRLARMLMAERGTT